MTPRILNIHIKSHAEEAELRQKESMFQAFLISRWVWQKKVDIESILNVKPEKKKEMSADAMLAMVKMLNAQLGGEVRVNGKTESNN
jgi:hypothetical protein